VTSDRLVNTAPRIIRIDPILPEPSLIEEVTVILKSGGVIGYPTETFYGLGADATQDEAIDKIFSIKGRNFQNPISIIIAERNDLSQWISEIPPTAQPLIEKFWPGPLTLVFQASSAVHPRLTAGTGKIAIRISSHPIAAALAMALGRPITATSANRSGAPESTSVSDVSRQLGSGLDAIIDGGETAGGKGSTIIDTTVHPLKVLREGAIASTLVFQIANQQVIS